MPRLFKENTIGCLLGKEAVCILVGALKPVHLLKGGRLCRKWYRFQGSGRFIQETIANLPISPTSFPYMALKTTVQNVGIVTYTVYVERCSFAEKAAPDAAYAMYFANISSKPSVIGAMTRLIAAVAAWKNSYAR
jgi:hypothetical protein